MWAALAQESSQHSGVEIAFGESTCHSPLGRAKIGACGAAKNMRRDDDLRASLGKTQRNEGRKHWTSARTFDLSVLVMF